MLLDKSVCVFVKIRECLAHSGPLLPNLLDQLVLNIPIDVKRAGCGTIVSAFPSLLLFHVLLETRVSPTIVPEDEAGKVVNFIAQP